ncbi:MAG: hypothetical protein J0I41_10675 [Filimonas sp.]|nr:hypothetical protein [Filimonas sp.]
MKSTTKLLIGCLAAIIVLASCASASKQADRNAKKYTKVSLFPEQQFDSVGARQALAYGTGSITGVVFKRVDTKNYGIKTEKVWGKNVKIVLFPVTPYFEEWYSLRKKKENNVTTVYMSESAYRFRIEVTSDDYGRFTFEKMKPGKYFLQAFLNWTVSGSYKQYTGYATDGYNTTNYYEWRNYTQNNSARLEEFVEVKKDGEIVKVKLN